MKITRFYNIWFYAIFATSVCFAIMAKAAEVVVSPATQSNSQHIRTLAASCAACHGSNGNAVAGSAALAGMDAQYFSKQMLAFKDGSRPATVMHHHAKGLNLDEIDLLALYFSQQKRMTNVVPSTQKLKADHE
jgi:cytochrome subunit of sulfide dehydrogenase